MDFSLMTALGIAFIFLMTTAGAALSFCFQKEMSERFQMAIFGFAAGVMLAAAIWSLLLPALEESEKTWNGHAFVPVTIGFLLGGVLIELLDYFFNEKQSNQESQTAWARAKKLFISVTIHNIPEGLSVGFAFGAAYVAGSFTSCVAALGLAIGVGIQNFPEGAAVALPIRLASGNKRKGFFYGAFSGVVEPIFAIIGFYFATVLQSLQAWLLAFSAGTMVFVVLDSLLPELQKKDEKSGGVWWVMIGFALMMILDVVFA